MGKNKKNNPSSLPSTEVSFFILIVPLPINSRLSLLIVTVTHDF